jgi:predicted RNA-binding protein
MCLSKVVAKNGSSEKLLLNNIQKFSISGGDIIFTDLMENETRITGRLVLADLVNGRVVVETPND